MVEHSLPDDAGRTDLGDGFILDTANLPGTVQVHVPQGARGLTADSIDPLLEQAGLHLEKLIILPSAEGARELTRAAAPPSATLRVRVKAGQSCLVLMEDEATQVLSWVISDDAREAGAARTFEARGVIEDGERELRFTLGLEVAGHSGARAFGGLGKKIKVFFYDITDKLFGPIIHGFAAKWETKHRPAFSRTFGTEDYRTDDPQFARLSSADWQRLGQGRALLFVHGTFSTCGAFAALSPEVLAELSRRYDGRLFAFNHPTLTADPRENALTFLRDIPAGAQLELDIVCHSRGGLVAREIASRGAAAGSVAVRRIVFVGATNAGTALADGDHLVAMIDRFTNIAKLVPHTPVTRIFDALVLVLKMLAHGLPADLEGLSAMNPKSAFLAGLNFPGSSRGEYFAIASNFEPKRGEPLFSLTRAKDQIIDRVFASAANDLVVPTEGVYAKNGAGGFPIEAPRLLEYGPGDAVIHTEYFSQLRTGEKLLEWLQPSADGCAYAAASSASGPSMEEIARTLDAFRNQALAALTGRSGLRGDLERAAEFTPAELERLRPHVVNLSEGTFRESGIYRTTAPDVDAMIREHIPRWAAAQPAGEPLRIVVYAHGGLVGERAGLRIALKHVEWWQKNGVYPIYFVWETGLFDALRSILDAVARKIPGLGARDFFDYTTDPLVQEGARALGGPHVWGAMKRNAERASASRGAAKYFAQRLRELTDGSVPLGNREVQLHAVGHSAGSIFHSWFIPAARAAGGPAFRTLQLLAPAITIPEFAARLGDRIGAGKDIDRAIIYTMKRHFEEADNCIGVYRKSLLYLIHHALESERRTPILGLDISIRSDVAAATLFGLNGVGAPGRVVCSVSNEGDGSASSRAKHHGDFDDDAPTMNSVAAHVLDAAQARVPYVANQSRALGDWPIADEWLEGTDLSAVGAGLGSVSGASTYRPPTGSASAVPAVAPPEAASLHTSPGISAKTPAAKPGAAKRALCIGIDAYPSPNTLHGCVNDTVLWERTLTSAGFDVTTLTDKRATHAAILASLRELVMRSKRGDVLVVQYSGHGTQVRDLDGDEDDLTDEALVPIDFEDGPFIIDDDLRAVFDLLPAGVNLTIFMDCCHSGTITRMLGRNAERTYDLGKARFLKRTDDWEEWMRAHERFREHARSIRSASMTGRAFIDQSALRWVNYSACDSAEVALESEGNGDFTRRATRLLAGDWSRMTHRQFKDAILAAFGEHRRQTPQLDCPDAFRDLPLLQPFV